MNNQRDIKFISFSMWHALYYYPIHIKIYNIVFFNYISWKIEHINNAMILLKLKWFAWANNHLLAIFTESRKKINKGDNISEIEKKVYLKLFSQSQK